MPRSNTFYPFLPLFLFFASCLAVGWFYNFSDYSWEGWVRSDCYPHCYCEKPTGRPLEQVSNSFSNLMYVLVGLLICTLPIRKVEDGERANLISSHPAYSILYGFTIIAIGFGSLFYHGSLTEFGRFFDWFGMYLFSSYIIVYSLARYYQYSFQTFALVYGIFIFSLVLAILNVPPQTRTYIFATMVFMAVGMSFVVQRKTKGNSKTLYMAASLIVLGVAYFIWTLDRNGIVCWPTSLIQGHAIWHCLTAFSTALVYLYLRSEVLPPFENSEKLTV